MCEKYRKQRYLAKAPNEALFVRLQGLIINLVDLDFHGKIKLEVKNGKIALSFVDLLEEFRLRNIAYENSLNSVVAKFKNHAPYRNIAMLAEQLRSCSGTPCLFKFTKKKYLDSLKRGEVRMTLASEYKKAGYNIAIHDDELNIQYQLPNLRLKLEDGTEVPVRDNSIERGAYDDYYVSCFSATFNPKLFIMFEDDACFIIKNGDTFSKEVIKRYREQYPNDLICFDKVSYLDPYRETKSKTPIEFIKTFDYSYEEEFRFVAFGRYPVKEKVQKICINVDKIDCQIVET